MARTTNNIGWVIPFILLFIAALYGCSRAVQTVTEDDEGTVQPSPTPVVHHGMKKSGHK